MTHRTVFALALVAGTLLTSDAQAGNCRRGFHPFRGLFHRRMHHAQPTACGTVQMGAYAHAGAYASIAAAAGPIAAVGCPTCPVAVPQSPLTAPPWAGPPPSAPYIGH